jgi:uncharacterized protein YndB with AHSA1/START domain
VRVAASIEIARSPEEVWELIADPRNDAKWCAHVVSVEQVTGDGPGPDARYDVVHRPVKLRGEKRMEMAVTEFDPPRRMGLREEEDDAIFEVTYELAEAGSGTRLTQTDEIAWKIPFPGPQIGRLMVNRGIRQQLVELKRVLESS